MAALEQPLIGGEWILQRYKSDRLPVITATALVKPTREGIPVCFQGYTSRQTGVVG